MWKKKYKGTRKKSVKLYGGDAMTNLFWSSFTEISCPMSPRLPCTEYRLCQIFRYSCLCVRLLCVLHGWIGVEMPLQFSQLPSTDPRWPVFVLLIPSPYNRRKDLQKKWDWSWNDVYELLQSTSFQKPSKYHASSEQIWTSLGIKLDRG